MGKITIEDMQTKISTMDEDYIIFSELNFDTWGDTPKEYMWSVIAYHYKSRDGVFMNHPHDYIRGYAIMLKVGHGIVDFEKAKEDMLETTGVIERLLRYTQFSDIELSVANEITQWVTQ